MAEPLERLLVILDVDECLVFAEEREVRSSDEFSVGRFAVSRRPHLDEFLRGLAAFSDVAYWSTGTDNYVHEIVAAITPSGIQPRFTWGRSRCTRVYDPELQVEGWAKDLKRLRLPSSALGRVIAVDDSPNKWTRSYGNLVTVPEFRGDPKDRVLPRLLEYIRGFEFVANVRTVEKRGWLARFS